MEAELPVTLVVRAANQRYDDLSVSCFLDWSIMKLKQHLSVAYPTQPELEHQKLIYSGKLLQDHEILQDILISTGESDDRPHTVHLVCTKILETSQPLPAEKDGLRFRKRQKSAEAATEEAASSQAPAAAPQDHPTPTISPEQMQYWQSQMSAARANPYMYQMMAYQHQMMAYQQACFMQYAQYMSQNQENSASEVEIEDQPRLPLNQNVQMGAGAAGEDVVDDEDDMRPRDWLDGMYMGLRLLLLANIIYFYSSFSRFAVVCAVVVAFYLLYNHIKKKRIAEHARRAQEEREAREEEQRRQGEEERRRAENNNNEIAEDAAEDPDINEPTQEDQRNAELEVQRWTASRILDTAKTFVVTFFTSLVPEPPVHH